MVDTSISITLHDEIIGRLYAVAECDGTKVGWATFIVDAPDGCAFCLEIKIASECRRRGIMSQMYAEVERHIGRHLAPSKQLTPESAAYWAKRGVSLRKGTEVKTAEKRAQEASERPRLRTRINGIDVE
ncbi:hypothetical protein GAY33_33710 [Azospirillum brasilense]|uniref:GNAT family N-acetyltransferase n=1 Tax=Azospirillum argentinense TaxID=2970906 RepID=UPI00190E8738|nr:GNAT family N-acetyltransferase [Azospirillum argentinense]MBK3804038.1 hypothetical protein [Azospirillum argentinense]